MSVITILTGVKTWFVAASAGTKIAVVAGSVAVVAGAVAVPAAVITNNIAENDVSKHPVVNGEIIANEELDPIWTDEENKWCYETITFMNNNAGKVPPSTQISADEVKTKCDGKGVNPMPEINGPTFIYTLKLAWGKKYCNGDHYNWNYGTATPVKSLC